MSYLLWQSHREATPTESRLAKQSFQAQRHKFPPTAQFVAAYYTNPKGPIVFDWRSVRKSGRAIVANSGGITADDFIGITNP